jgi:hypothetical protein
MQPFAGMPPPSEDGASSRREEEAYAGQAAALGHFDMPFQFDFLGTAGQPAQSDAAGQQQLIDLLSAINGSAPPALPTQHAFAQFAEAPFPQSMQSAFPHTDGSHAAALVDPYNTFRGTSTGSSAFSIDGQWDDHEVLSLAAPSTRTNSTRSLPLLRSSPRP